MQKVVCTYASPQMSRGVSRTTKHVGHQHTCRGPIYLSVPQHASKQAICKVQESYALLSSSTAPCRPSASPSHRLLKQSTEFRSQLLMYCTTWYRPVHTCPHTHTHTHTHTQLALCQRHNKSCCASAAGHPLPRPQRANAIQTGTSLHGQPVLIIPCDWCSLPAVRCNHCLISLEKSTSESWLLFPCAGLLSCLTDYGGPPQPPTAFTHAGGWATSHTTHCNAARTCLAVE